MATRDLQVPNISCGHCVATIERELGELPGVRKVTAEHPAKRVTVEWDEDAQSWPAIRELLVDIGYPPAE